MSWSLSVSRSWNPSISGREFDSRRQPPITRWKYSPCSSSRQAAARRWRPRHRRASPRCCSRRSLTPSRPARPPVGISSPSSVVNGADAAASMTRTCWASAAITRSDVHARELLRGDRRARLHQHFEPHGEAIRIELFVAPGPGRPPQVEIEYGLQLFGRRQRDEIAAVLESAGLDDPVQHLGFQARNDLFQVRGIQNALEQVAHALAPPARTSFSQGRRMLPAAPKNSLERGRETTDN